MHCISYTFNLVKMKIKNGLKSEKHNGYKPKEERSEQVQADHELFLQAFESKSLVLFVKGY